MLQPAAQHAALAPGVEPEDVGEGALNIAIGEERLFEFIQICSVHPVKMVPRRAKINENLSQRLAAAFSRAGCVGSQCNCTLFGPKMGQVELTNHPARR